MFRAILTVFCENILVFCLVVMVAGLLLQIQARLQVIRQRLQSDPGFRAMYRGQVSKEMQLEQQLDARLTKEGKNRQAKVRVTV